MKPKTRLQGVVAVGSVIALGLLPAVASATTGTTGRYVPTTISVTGHASLHVQHVVARDPWSRVETTWIPMSYVQKTLKQVGFETTWNGTAFSLVKYPPGHALAALGNPEAPTATRNQIQIHLVAGAPPSAVVPKFVARNSASGVETVYMPLYYLDEILNYYWKMGATWNGVTGTWSLDFHPIK